MSPVAEEVLRAAEALSPEDRSELLEALLAAEPDADDVAIPSACEKGAPVELSPEWLAEIRRRSAEYDAGRDPGVLWEEVKRQARDRADREILGRA